MVRKNFHRTPDPQNAVKAFVKAESDKGLRVYWDKGHIQANNNGEAHNNPGVGIYCVSCRPSDDYDQQYSRHTSHYMLLRNIADVEEMFTYYEDGE